MKLRGDNPEVGAWRAVVANVGLGLSRAAAALMTGNLGFLTDALHDIGDGGSFAAKALATERHLDHDASRRLRLGAAAIMASGGMVGLGSGIVTLLGEHTENASPSAIAVAVLTTGVSALVARSTHKSKENHPDHAAVHDTHNHALADVASSGVYAGALALQNLTSNPDVGGGGLIASGVITLGAAAKVFRDIRNGSDHDHEHPIS